MILYYVNYDFYTKGSKRFIQASIIIMADSSSANKSTSPQDLQNKPFKLKRACREDEINHYIEFGLGKGINVTEHDMWKSRTTHLVRKPCKHPNPCKDTDMLNIVGTQESGFLEGYRKEVSQFDTQQQKLSLSFGMLGASPMSIGVDEQFSKSVSSTKVVKGERIETRTISFKRHFKASESIEQEYIEQDSKSEERSDIILQLVKQLEEKNDEDKKKVCKEFVDELGITHYVSAIKLGACEYYSAFSRSEQARLNVGTSVEAGPLAKASFSTLLEKVRSFRGEEKWKIGRIDKEDKMVTIEGVIGFEIQPLYELITISPKIQSFLKEAIREYTKEHIESKQGEWAVFII